MSKVAETPAADTRCLRCGRKLRSAQAIARRMGDGCWRKVRKAEASAGQSGAFSPEQHAKAAAAIRSGEVKAEGPGLYSVPSSKDDGTRYATDGRSCCCPAGAVDHRCWHLLVALVLDTAFAKPAPPKVTVPSDDIWDAIDRLNDAFMAMA